ncbi:four helix bundle protein [Reichenbachiella agarivorans]|uniref:Four helix bundle protein n=1 Tax=Reichenbachiella agarivorans TaxID=2979464 RepID=A0ABY6CMX1_9BACT|nr:four helix bundle protein [Reichenbachiella agarivorans]UXP31865.1 four helix bundle protein [Reichenbachiella agarivorans]
MGFKFENLKVWQDAINLSSEVHLMTLTWTKEERYILTSQIKRASDSISLNISEGSTGQSNAEFIRFLRYANRSALEVITCLYLAKNRDLIHEDQFKSLYDQTETLVIKIQALIKSMNQNS